MTLSPATLAAVATLRAVSTSHSVVLEHDGCHCKDLFTGTDQACMTFLRKHWRRTLDAGFELGLRSNVSGRMQSFVL